MTTNIIRSAAQTIENQTARSAWNRGVKVYALELLEQLAEIADGGDLTLDALASCARIRALLLNGARDWKQYSWGGGALIYDSDIAERLCTASELRKTKGGELRPNASEEWLDTQARALHQAANLAISAILSETAQREEVSA